MGTKVREIFSIVILSLCVCLSCACHVLQISLELHRFGTIGNKPAYTEGFWDFGISLVSHASDSYFSLISQIKVNLHKM